MNELMIFEGHEVEVFELNGEVFFNPYHVGICLGMAAGTVKDHMSKMSGKQVIKLKNSDVGSTNFRKLNNAGENFLTESGVYKLVFKSRKPNAEKFTDWVTDEVLPTLRKTGTYTTKPLSTSEQIQLIAKGYEELNEKIDSANEEIAEIKKRLDVIGSYDNEWMLKKLRGVTSARVMEMTQNPYYRELWSRYFYAGIYKTLKDRFKVATLKSIPTKHLDEAIEIICNWKPTQVFLSNRINEMKGKQEKNLLPDKKIIALLQYLNQTNDGTLNPFR